MKKKCCYFCSNNARTGLLWCVWVKRIMVCTLYIVLLLLHTLSNSKMWFHFQDIVDFTASNHKMCLSLLFHIQHKHFVHGNMHVLYIVTCNPLKVTSHLISKLDRNVETHWCGHTINSSCALISKTTWEKCSYIASEDHYRNLAKNDSSR